MTPKPNEQNYDIDEYNQVAALLEQRCRDSTTALDEKILYLAAGALGLSLTFIGSVIDSSPVIYGWAIVLSWFTLTASIICNLLGFRFVTKKSELEAGLDILKQSRGIPPYDKNGPEPEAAARHGDAHMKTVERYNQASFWLLIIGIVLMVLFVSCNTVRHL